MADDPASGQDPLEHAEFEMARAEVDLASELMRKVWRQLRAAGHSPDEIPSDEVLLDAIQTIADEDAEARELIERLDVFHRFRRAGRE